MAIDNNGYIIPNEHQLMVMFNLCNDERLGYLKSIVAQEKADQAWQRAFDNVLAGVDEEIIGCLAALVEDVIYCARDHGGDDAAAFEREYYDEWTTQIFTTQNGQKTTSSFENGHFHN